MTPATAPDEPVDSPKSLAEDRSTTSQNLDLLAETLDEVEALPAFDQAPNPVAEGVLTQAMPQAVAQTTATQAATDPLLSAKTSSTQKEATESVSLDQVAADAARGAQLAEVEPQPEIPPEVESYLQKVEERPATAPQEIVIADGSQTTPAQHSYPSQPVIVLPITAEEEKAGVKKSPKFSIRWLVEWSRKLMKAFMGKVIYRPVEESSA
jgi:hypothetical protein